MQTILYSFVSLWSWCYLLFSTWNGNFIEWVESCKISSERVLTMAWWRHQLETFSVLLALCAGNSPVTGEFPVQRPVTRSFDVSFDLRLE